MKTKKLKPSKGAKPEPTVTKAPPVDPERARLRAEYLAHHPLMKRGGR